MVEFLIKRPIAVSMTFLAIIVLGIVAALRLPVSLMPDIDIPKITVEISSKNMPARELENTVISPLRNQLIQLAHLEDIESQTRDGHCIIQLIFSYKTEVDYAFIEVNEKIDRAMQSLPRDLPRPRVMKASVTDIPVFYLNISLKDDNTNLIATDTQPVSQKFMELSRFAANVIKKRIEQLQEVAMVDLSGKVNSEIALIPDWNKLDAMNISLSTLENALKNQNINLGNLLIRDGQYEYNVRFRSTLKNIHDIENTYIKIEERLFQLKELIDVKERPQKRSGLVTMNGREAVSMAVIKHSDAQMEALKTKLSELIGHFNEDYPHVTFDIVHDQSALLDYSISNVKRSLLWGSLLAFLIMFFFLGDFKSPLLIGITIPVSLIVSLLFFYVFNISINIISLSGLVLGIGMMIDNSIIVIDNIGQYRTKNGLLDQSCVDGTNEVIRPLISSVLTTCAVFIPLIFISGISGALFYDQAMAVTIGLLVSLAISITLLPVYFRLLYKNGKGGDFRIKAKIDFERIYEKGFRLVMKNQGKVWLLFVLLLLGTWILYHNLDKQKLPSFGRSEILVDINWNEKIHVEENKSRVIGLMKNIKEVDHYMGMIGKQQFLLGKRKDATTSEATIYIKASSQDQLTNISTKIENLVNSRYSSAMISFNVAESIFDLIFSDNQPPLLAKLRPVNTGDPENNRHLADITENIRKDLPDTPISPPAWQEQIILTVDAEKLLAYDIKFETVYSKLKSAFNENEILNLFENQELVPVIIGGKSQVLQDILHTLTVQNANGILIPVRTLFSEARSFDLKTIRAGKEGEYFPLAIAADQESAGTIMGKIKGLVNNSPSFEVSFTGKVFSNRQLVKELFAILLIALLLLYFILAAQFESLTLPFIVLLEVPIDVFGAFLMLKIFGASINLMSMIGIVVMSGIIINDSILKIDTINRLFNHGTPLLRALSIAGKRRLKPIIMTSITTILALMPFLFSKGLGADLQKPLALAVIGGMTIGTLVSLYFIPLLYYLLKRKEQ